MLNLLSQADSIGDRIICLAISKLNGNEQINTITNAK